MAEIAAQAWANGLEIDGERVPVKWGRSRPKQPTNLAGPSAIALPNTYGNSNGLIPVFIPTENRGPNRMWFQRAAAAVLPSTVINRLGLARRVPTGPIGGGTSNDGVFANVTAKPSAPVRVEDGA